MEIWGVMSPDTGVDGRNMPPKIHAPSFILPKTSIFCQFFQAIRFIDANCLKKFGEKILTSSWVKNSPQPKKPEKWSFWSRRPFLWVIMTGIEIFRKCHRIALVTPYPVTSLKKAIFTVCLREKCLKVKNFVDPKHTVSNKPLGCPSLQLSSHHWV